MDLIDLAKLIRYTKEANIGKGQIPTEIPKFDFGKHELVKRIVTPLLEIPFIEDKIEELAKMEIEWA